MLLDRIDFRVNEFGPLASIANAGNKDLTVELYGCTYKFRNWGGFLRVGPLLWYPKQYTVGLVS